MWYLKNSTGERIYLKPNKSVTFGRKRSDIILQNDESISRVHASLHVQPKEAIKEGECVSTCTLKDEGSKYGTYVFLDDSAVDIGKEGYVLKDKDKIRFGLQDHIFTVIYVPMVTIGSGLSHDEKCKLYNLLNEIDGMFSETGISTCTHLTMSAVVLTEKVTWALATAMPIVTVEFWEEVKRAMENGTEIPETNKYVPPIFEGLMSNEKLLLCPNEKRKTLFQNLIFVYFSARQYATYGKIINAAGGQSVLYSKKPLTDKQLCYSNVIVVQYSNFNETQSTQDSIPEYESIYKMLQDNKRKMIPDSDIPLALFHCSIEKYCNPKYNFGNLLKRSQSECKTSNILALDTQDVSGDVRILPKVISNVPVKSNINIKQNAQKIVKIIPETCDTYDESPSKNRHLPSTSKQRTESQGRRNYIPETKDSFSSSITNESQHNRSKLPLLKKTEIQIIPETNDSYDKSKLILEKDTASGSIKISSKDQQLGTGECIQFKEVTITRNLTPSKDKKHQNNKHEDSQQERNSAIRPSSNNSRICLREDLTRSPDIYDVPDSDDEMLSPQKKSDKAKSDTNDKIVSTPVEESRKSKRKCFNTSDDLLSESSEEFSTPPKKRVCKEDDRLESFLKSPEVPLSPKNDNEVYSNSSVGNKSFLRSEIVCKKFQKVYKMIPEKRITEADMYVWNGSNNRSF